MRIKFRDVSETIHIFREILLGRKWFGQLRFAPLMSPRTYPPLCPPPTTHDKLSKNEYRLRNARTEVKQPLSITIETINETTKKSSVPTPGKVYNFDDHRAEYSPMNVKIK